MAYEDRDGPDHAGKRRPHSQEGDRGAGAGEQGHDAQFRDGDEHGSNETRPEDWFGGDTPTPPPPPYAQHQADSDSSVAYQPPMHARGADSRHQQSPVAGAAPQGNGRSVGEVSVATPSGAPWSPPAESPTPPPDTTGGADVRVDAPADGAPDDDLPEPEPLPPLEGTFAPVAEDGSSNVTTDQGQPAAPPSAPSESAPAAPAGTAPPSPEAAVQPDSPPSGGQPRPAVPETAEALQAETLVRSRREPPTGGWRRAVHAATFGLVHPGESPAELRRRELVARARTHVAGGHHRVAIMSLKGGVGKTTTTVALGSTLASLRGDRVLAVDANPDRGTLSDKVRLETAATIRDLLNERHLVRRYADIRGFTSQAASRLEILASDRDPAVSEAFSETDYRQVADLLEHFYSITLTDCGTGLLHSAMSGVLQLADQIVLVSTASVDGARSASATLDWLEAHAYGYLVQNAVVVLSMVPTGKSSVDVDRLTQHFASRGRQVVTIPWDAHLEEGAEVDLDQLHATTRHAYLNLAAAVGDAFAWTR
ncbi:nucleotide-binding protein [Salinactinospora qingdaonensis]|uniref:CobQ/CobB/MinD/ParA nucleotide binding domain-containing protein n=1 Tax=Salinactinospora qingdaonensis TaxID=702744 RepID=A0ABP7FIP7_9ACTN